MMRTSTARAHAAAARIAAAALAVAILPAVCAGIARADGGFFRPWGKSIWEYQQVAVLDWNEQTSSESLTILPAIQGSARDFAWVVPVPTRPTAAAASREPLQELVTVTAPLYRNRDAGWSCERSVEIGYDATEGGGVDVIETGLVGDYDVTILGADDAAALADTLTAWGFLHAGDETQVQPALDDYVSRGWFFVTMKVDSVAFSASHPGYGDYYGVGLEPIKLTFTTTAPVYPMRLSAVSAYWTTTVCLFAISDHRLDLPGATTLYANRFGEDELEALGRSSPAAADLLRPGCFLTRLERVMSPAQMDRDLPLTRYRNDDEFRQIRYSGVPLFTTLFAAAPLWWAARKARRRRARSRRS
jgi:hypothetical protein